MVLGDDKTHGTSSVTRVGPAGRGSTRSSCRQTPTVAASPPAARYRRTGPRRRCRRRRRPRSACRPRGTGRSTPALLLRACRCWRGTRRSRSTRPTPPAPGGARAASTSTRTGIAMSSASAWTAPASPRSARTGGWIRAPLRAGRRAPSWWCRGPRRSAVARPPGRAPSAPRPDRGSCRGRPAEPGRRRAGRARSGAARRPSGRPCPPGTRSAPAPAARGPRCGCCRAQLDRSVPAAGPAARQATTTAGAAPRPVPTSRRTRRPCRW